MQTVFAILAGRGKVKGEDLEPGKRAANDERGLRRRANGTAAAEGPSSSSDRNPAGSCTCRE
jgi:hypothetical protein